MLATSPLRRGSKHPCQDDPHVEFLSLLKRLVEDHFLRGLEEVEICKCVAPSQESIGLKLKKIDQKGSCNPLVLGSQNNSNKKLKKLRRFFLSLFRAFLQVVATFSNRGLKGWKSSFDFGGCGAFRAFMTPPMQQGAEASANQDQVHDPKKRDARGPLPSSINVEVKKSMKSSAL